jgi:hypothetical protein
MASSLLRVETRTSCSKRVPRSGNQLALIASLSPESLPKHSILHRVSLESTVNKVVICHLRGVPPSV